MSKEYGIRSFTLKLRIWLSVRLNDWRRWRGQANSARSSLPCPPDQLTRYARQSKRNVIFGRIWCGRWSCQSTGPGSIMRTALAGLVGFDKAVKSHAAA